MLDQWTAPQNLGPTLPTMHLVRNIAGGNLKPYMQLPVGIVILPKTCKHTCMSINDELPFNFFAVIFLYMNRTLLS